MIRANLYEKSIHIDSYVSSGDCKACGFHSRTEFIDSLRAGRLKPSQCKIARMRFLPLLWAARPNEILPEVEVLQLPNPGPTGFFPINQPEKNSPILVSGNSKLTVEVLTAVLSTTLSPFWYMVVDTDGHTVDMAMVYEALTAERVTKVLTREKADQIAPESTLFLPGFAAPIRDTLAEQSGRSVTIGPVCAAELPLFFGKMNWKVA
jgi:CO dehydrogenase/acetyl-CoA synthase gamma subunit (corrinoid Fe-S protein)